MPKAHDKPSIRDVAAVAGVSYQTVSRVLNEPSLVRRETAERVHSAIEELGYRPSKAARSLATNDSMTIGVVSVHAALFGPSQTALAIDEGARSRGYSTASVTVRNDNPDVLNEAREHLLGLGVDGVVVIAWSEASLGLAERFAGHIPTSVVAEGPVPQGLARARGDNHGGAEQAVAALRESGRRCIAHLAGPDEWLEARARRDGWAEAAREAPGPVVTSGWDPAGGYRGVDELLALAPELDAIFAANDHVAVGALRRLSELGCAVPGDIALVGYDDTDVAPFLSVPLASVRQPFTAVGSAAIDLLFDLFDGRPTGERLLPSRFVWRESAGSPVVA
ncbi:transcriptional regulator, LacI family [Tessaracoccus bendigoensis DSM 12906]|uniref:Transcriptional regulator, LacI family n=1 Tax=Tessaracoccus bendigoensis DSM 12906 TaxID=1123357 RepID=A0A1M6D136_9ACTN|nr:LacI family DNA-binding transcriptional regulator [Tessaracoccus bendigoensis]SHI66833.1 transcriptional regulator, LacI family [Tessaracoccus bendigoensis DSM 12906]